MRLTGNVRGEGVDKRYERVCDCGATLWSLKSNLKTKVCSDCRNKQLSEKKKTHGASGYTRDKSQEYKNTPKVYTAWKTMTRRCRDKKMPYYFRYGGRGVSVCDRWLGSDGFVNFLSDMGNPPMEGNGNTYQLDRIDNDGNYTKDNCRWVTHKDNSRNTSVVLRYTHNGLDFCITKWLDLIGMKYSMFSDRYYRFGWSIQEALGFVSVTGRLGAIRKPSELNWLAKKSISFDKTA